MDTKARILIVDDEVELRRAAEKILAREGYRVATCATAGDGLAHFEREGADLLITDLMLPDQDGIAVLRRAKELRPDIEAIVITAHGSVETAVEAMRLGAYDFILKPLDRAVLLKTVTKALEKQGLAAENRALREQLQQRHGEDALVGNSPAMLATKKLIRQIAPTDVSVLIQGESGTGKEVVADVIHALSQRHAQPIVKISCAAIPETLLESELFGYERGAFTGATGSKPGKFEAAHGGTLFLDEIAEMSPALQAKLLRVLQDGRFQRLGSNKDLHVDVRVISATHVDIPAAIEQTKFREDLYYRLNVIHVELPPLRDRREDIPLLADHFLKKYAARMQKNVAAIAPKAVEQLLAHHWPGNVRELENAIQRALAVATEQTIRNFQLLSLPAAASSAARGPAGPMVAIPLGTPLEEAEHQIVTETLKQCGGNKEKAAKLLGVSSRTLYRRFAAKRG
ncbi:MAG: sigma-54-dependent Fis family transcriptional regulator [Verrucomicrobia bacterium]|nr:sigma-54-dependent Fis family transcriptional regulator [Verrucomicrobiota bacterium]